MKIVIAGCGRVGAGLAATLSLSGHRVSLIDPDPRAFGRLGKAFRGDTVEGSAIDREALVRAGIARADGLAAVTARDEVNVVCARIARTAFRVPRAVARIYDPGKAEVYRRLGLLTISPVTWGVHRIAELLCLSGLSPVAALGSGEVEVVEAEVPPLLAGREVGELSVPGEVTVVAVSRAGRTFLPQAGALFREGDVAHLAVLGASLGRLRGLLGQG